MDMRCGPIDRSLLVQQDEHISTLIWEGGDRVKLDVRQYTALQGVWDLRADQRHMLDSWGFGVFANPHSVPQNDISLIKSLVERWRPETNSFHFTFGEMTITLEDVYMIMGLPISGRALTHTELTDPSGYWFSHWEDLRLHKEQRKEMYGSGGVKLCAIRERYHMRSSRSKRPDFLDQDCRVYTRAYVLYIIGAILFPSSSRYVVHPRYLQLLQDPDQIIDYAWGAAVLAHLYRALSKSVKKSCNSFNGCAMLLQLWAWERLNPGRPEIAPRQEFQWPRALAWVVPVQRRRINPHHHTSGYRGDFDSFQPHWVTWQSYARFYERDDADEDADMYMARHMALGRIPMVSFEFIEYQMPDRVLRQFGMLQHIPEDPIDHSFLRTERLTQFQRDAHMITYRSFLDEWTSYVQFGLPITVEGEYVPIQDYLQWYRRVSKLRIAPCVVPADNKIQPRDWFPQQSAVDALESAMRLVYQVHLHKPDKWFYDKLPDFLFQYDRVNTEWRGSDFSRPSFFGEEDIEAPVVDSPIIDPPVVDPLAREMDIDPSAPGVSQKSPLEVGTSVPDALMHDTPLHVSLKRPREVDTTSPLMDTTHDVMHVSPTRHVVPTSQSFAFTPIPLKVSTSEETPSTERVHPVVTFGFGSASMPTNLKNKFDLDTKVDKMKDERDRGGIERSGDMTRPLKNRKIRWLFRHWWSNDGEFIWFTHDQKGVTMPLTKDKLLTLKPGCSLVDDVVNGYVELMKIREYKLWHPENSLLRPPARRFFFAFSWWMTLAMRFCDNLSTPPDGLTGVYKGDMEKFISTYHMQHLGPDLLDCDFAFFPTCYGEHWILFVANIKTGKVLLVDPIRDESTIAGKEVYPIQYYIMEKFLPYMLHKLDEQRFEMRYMRVKEVFERSKQKGGVDCGVFVCKYMDAICNGISLKKAEWEPERDIITFRYRIANELRNGEARHISTWG